jgi:protein involved in ribonucleotide reduction
MTDLVYFSSSSGNTKRFIDKLGREAVRIPLHSHKDGVKQDTIHVSEPFVLVVPTYGGGVNSDAVPQQVKRFLNDENNRSLIRGVIGIGNTNFGKAYCLAGDIVAAKCKVPHLYQVEVFGTPDDVRTVKEGLDSFWMPQ